MATSTTAVRLTLGALGSLLLVTATMAWDARSHLATAEDVKAVAQKADAAATKEDVKALAVKVDAAASKDDVDALSDRMDGRFRAIETTIGTEFLRAETGKAMIETMRAEAKGRADVLEAKLDSVLALMQRADNAKP